MTANEYIEFVLADADPYRHSVADPEFKTLDRRDQARVVAKFDGYGLRDLIAARKRSSPDAVRAECRIRDHDVLPPPRLREGAISPMVGGVHLRHGERVQQTSLSEQDPRDRYEADDVRYDFEPGGHPEILADDGLQGLFEIRSRFALVPTSTVEVVVGGFDRSFQLTAARSAEQVTEELTEFRSLLRLIAVRESFDEQLLASVAKIVRCHAGLSPRQSQAGWKVRCRRS